MPRVFAALNARQVEVLRWIGDGCPDDVMDGYTYKTTAVALQSRRLVTVSKKGGVWRAAITDAGTYYLEHGTYETSLVTAPVPRQVESAPRPAGQPRRRDAQPPRAPSVMKAASPTRALSPTAQLIADLVANGEINVPKGDRAKYEARVNAAIRYAKVPEGKQLVTEGSRWSSDYIIRLRDAPAWLNATLEPIPLPATLRRPHPVVALLQSDKRLVFSDRSVIHRALLLIQALAAEATRRGYAVEETKITTDSCGYRHRESKDDFTVTIDRSSVGVELRQEIDRTRHEPTAAEEAKAARDRWYRIPKYDTNPTNRLSVHLSGRFEHRQSKWTDSRSGRLEDWLAQILQEIELRAEAAEQDRLAAIAEAERRHRLWEAAMEEAKRDYVEAYRADILRRQLVQWRRARQMEEYLHAMRGTIDAIADPDEAAAAKVWHEWAIEWAKSEDPLARPLAMPVVPDPKAEDLKPFLKGWNPYGPDLRW